MREAEVEKLLEETITIMSPYPEHYDLTMPKVKKALTLLRAKPSAGEFTARIRKEYVHKFVIAKDSPHKRWETERDLSDACDLLDASKAENEKLRKALEKIANPKTPEGLYEELSINIAEQALKETL